MPKKVPFQVVHCSGADEGHSARELEVLYGFVFGKFNIKCIKAILTSSQLHKA